MPIPADHSFLITGIAEVWIGFGPTGPAEMLGICNDQARVSIIPHFTPIQSDAAGVELPADYQYMGRNAMVWATLSSISISTLEKMFAFQAGAAQGTPDGTEMPRGFPIAATGRHLRVSIRATKPYRFLTCIMRQPVDLPHGTRASLVQFGFESWKPPVLNSAGQYVPGPLYDHVIEA